MNLREFNRVIILSAHPVILLEGTRALPEGRRYNAVVRFAVWLAERYPHAVFRTGNAKGADDAFAQGVKHVDPTRLQYVLPYAGHREAGIHEDSRSLSIEEIGVRLNKRIIRCTVEVSPKAVSFFDREEGELPPKIRAQAKYLLRDTLKVIGNKALGPATVGLFYVNKEDPMKGGTGHTIRVCRDRAVPVAFQDEWLGWHE